MVVLDWIPELTSKISVPQGKFQLNKQVGIQGSSDRIKDRLVIIGVLRLLD